MASESPRFTNPNLPHEHVDIDDPHTELAAVEDEIERTSATLKALIHRKHELKMRINQFYCSIRLLPPEIIIEIFQWCIPPFTSVDEKEIFTATPLFIGSICSTWRKIAWSTPTLWASLNLHLKASLDNTKTELLEQWLSRSGDLPLSLRLFSTEEIPFGTPSNPGTALEVMSKYAKRWRDLDLRIPTSCYRFLPGPEEMLPLLESLHINPPGGQGERRHTIDMSYSARIQSLSLSCVFLISMKFRWDQVTHLQLEAFYVDECLEAMRQTPQLVSCTLRNIIRGDDGHAYPDAPISLSSLRDLSIDNEKDTHIASLLEIISAPNLKHFSYSGRYLIHCPQICALISRSSGLHTFSLIRTIISSDNIFIQLLRGLKAVSKFIFIAISNPISWPLNDNVLLRCDPTHPGPLDDGCLLPALQELEYCGPQIFTWPVMLQVLESRQPSGLWDPGRLDSMYQRTAGAIADLRSVKITLTDISIDPDNPRTQFPRTQLEEVVFSRLSSLSISGLKVSVTMIPAQPPDGEA